MVHLPSEFVILPWSTPIAVLNASLYGVALYSKCGAYLAEFFWCSQDKARLITDIVSLTFRKIVWARQGSQEGLSARFLAISLHAVAQVLVFPLYLMSCHFNLSQNTFRWSKSFIESGLDKFNHALLVLRPCLLDCSDDSDAWPYWKFLGTCCQESTCLHDTIVQYSWTQSSPFVQSNIESRMSCIYIQWEPSDSQAGSDSEDEDDCHELRLIPQDQSSGWSFMSCSITHVACLWHDWVLKPSTSKVRVVDISNTYRAVLLGMAKTAQYWSSCLWNMKLKALSSDWPL